QASAGPGGSAGVETVQRGAVDVQRGAGATPADRPLVRRTDDWSGARGCAGARRVEVPADPGARADRYVPVDPPTAAGPAGAHTRSPGDFRIWRSQAIVPPDGV